MNLVGVKITVTDVKKAGICMREARAWCARNNISLSELLSGGVDAQQFWDTGDGYAQLIVRRKLEREGLTNG